MATAGVGRRKTQWGRRLVWAGALAAAALLGFGASRVELSPLVDRWISQRAVANQTQAAPPSVPVSSAVPSALAELESDHRPHQPAAITTDFETTTAAVEPAASLAMGEARVTLTNRWNPAIQVSIDGGESIRLATVEELELTPGPHSLTFSLAAGGYRATQTVNLELSPGQSQAIRVPIRPPGRLSVQAHLGSPQGLVRIGTQRLLSPTPLRGHALKPGRHRVAIFSHEDRTTPAAEVVLEVRTGHESIVTFDLEGDRAPHVREKALQ